MQLVPWYLLDAIVGYEGEGEGESSEGTSEGEGEEEPESEEEPEGEGTEGGESGKPPTQDDIDKLNKALRAERKLRREAQKEATTLKKTKEEKTGASDEEAEQARQRAAAADQKSERLAGKLRDTAIEGAIVKAATRLEFRDVEDAITLVSRDDIDWEQDEDDPSSIKVDADSVRDAVKELAKKRPYLLKTESNDEGASGGRFGGRGGQSDSGLSEEVLRDTYPALRRGGSI